jgi:hypothetical protein
MGLSKTLQIHSNQLTLLNEMKKMKLSSEIRLKKGQKWDLSPHIALKALNDMLLQLHTS